jgi:hypothetical protein
VESAPQAYGLEASNAAPPFSTSAGTSPIQDAICIKNERERYGERRKTVTDGTINNGRK